MVCLQLGIGYIMSTSALNNKKEVLFIMDNEINLDKLLKQVEQADLMQLMNAASYEEDEDKKKVLEALFTYALDKRQEKIINEKDFVR